MAHVESLTGKQVVGNVETESLDVVATNDWNPNHMTPEQYASLKHGLEHDGWLSNQALLVWGSDENGVEKNIIIDGEHRYRVALELGFTHGPMVFLEKLSEAKAKSLTVGMNHKRGTSNVEELGELLRSIQVEVPDLALSVGVGHDDLLTLLSASNEAMLESLPGAPPRTRSAPAVDAEPSLVPGASSPPTEATRIMQFYFNADNHATMTEMLASLAESYGTKTPSATVYEAITRAFDTGV